MSYSFKGKRALVTGAGKGKLMCLCAFGHDLIQGGPSSSLVRATLKFCGTREP